MKQPPILGPKPLPVADRPACLYCKRKLKPAIQTVSATLFYGPEIKRPHGPAGRMCTTVHLFRYFTGAYGWGSTFCGKNCAALMAYGRFARSAEFPRLKRPEVPDSVLRFVADALDDGWRQQRDGPLELPADFLEAVDPEARRRKQAASLEGRL